MAHGFCRTAGMVTLVLLLGGCGCDCGEGGPYIFSPAGPSLVGARSFAIRYSDWRNDPEEIRALIAGQCGPSFTTARMFVQPYQGTLLHPQQAAVVCGDPGVPAPAYPGQEIDPGTLIRLH